MVGVGESALLLEKEDKKESGPGSGKKRSNKNQQNLSGTNNEPRPKNQAEESKKYCIYHALGIVHRISSGGNAVFCLSNFPGFFVSCVWAYSYQFLPICGHLR
jgi:hypothetical protein